MKCPTFSERKSSVLDYKPIPKLCAVSFVVNVLFILFPFHAHTAAGEDYTPLSQELLFSSETPREQSVSILITDDSEVETRESFRVRLRFGPQEEEEGEGILLIPNEATVTITDNDSTSDGTEIAFQIFVAMATALYPLIIR